MPDSQTCLGGRANLLVPDLRMIVRRVIPDAESGKGMDPIPMAPLALPAKPLRSERYEKGTSRSDRPETCHVWHAVPQPSDRTLPV